jgi:4-hydroxybenzoate polyprenyltransferase
MSKILPYIYLIRLHRPLPILLLLWPTYWALWIAANGIPPIKILIIFTVGIFLMRSAGGVFNDMADHKFDHLVERTKTRPITSGQLSLKQGLVTAGILCFLAFILVCMLNPLTISLSFCALGLAIFYPFAKRFTYWPQAVLGLAYNFGVIMAFAAVQNHVPIIAFGIWIIAVFWTLAYDTIYAMADRMDDVKIGIRSTAVLFGSHVAWAVAIFQGLTVMGLAILGWYLHFKLGFYICLIIGGILLGFQHKLIKNKAYIKAFSDNHWFGLLVFIGIFMQFI